MKTIAKITLAIGILCLFAFAQTKPKAAVYIKGNPEGRDFLRSAVNTFLIKSGKYQMIAVDAIDVVAQEQNRQNSGSVSNEDIAQLGKDAGAQYVCVVERSESDGISYVSTSMVSVQSKIAELSEMSELPRGERIINLIERQINKMLGISTPEPEPEPEPAPEYTQSPPVENTYSANYDDYSVPLEVDNGLEKPKSNKNIWKSLALTFAGAGLVYAGIHYHHKKYYHVSDITGWSLVIGGFLLVPGVFSLFDGGM